MGEEERQPPAIVGPPQSLPRPDPDMLKRLAAAAREQEAAPSSEMRRAAMRWLGPVCLLLCAPILAPALLVDFAMSRRWGRVGSGMTFFFGFIAVLGSWWWAISVAAAAVLFVLRWPVRLRGYAFGYSGLVIHTLMLGGAIIIAAQVTQMFSAFSRPPSGEPVELAAASQLANEAPREAPCQMELTSSIVDWDQALYCVGAPDGPVVADACAHTPTPGALRWAPLHAGERMVWIALPDDVTEIPAPLFGTYYPRPAQMESVLALLPADTRPDRGRFGVLLLDLRGPPRPAFWEAHPPAVVGLASIGALLISSACFFALREHA